MLKLQDIATFTTPVEINAPGGAIKITVDFVHMSRDERKAFAESEEMKTFSDEPALLMKIMRGWSNVDLPFSHEAVEKMCGYYPSAAVDIVRQFFDEMKWDKAKEKN